MWGSENETPDPVQSRFGYRKMNNIPNTVIVNEIVIHPYMSPSDGTTQQIVQTIQNAEQSLHFCIFSFTHDDIGSAMEAKQMENNQSPRYNNQIITNDQIPIFKGKKIYLFGYWILGFGYCLGFVSWFLVI